MIAFIVCDMTSVDSAGTVIKAVRAVDDDALVQVNMGTLTVKIEPTKASARELSDAIRVAGYTPVAA